MWSARWPLRSRRRRASWPAPTGSRRPRWPSEARSGRTGAGRGGLAGLQAVDETRPAIVRVHWSESPPDAAGGRLVCPPEYRLPGLYREGNLTVSWTVPRRPTWRSVSCRSRRSRTSPASPQSRSIGRARTELAPALRAPAVPRAFRARPPRAASAPPASCGSSRPAAPARHRRPPCRRRVPRAPDRRTPGDRCPWP